MTLNLFSLNLSSLSRPLLPWRDRQRTRLGWLACLTLPLLSNCSLVGPDTIKAGRTDYNLAIQQTHDQELLLNLVRLRYRDNLYFLNVERIASTVEINRSLSASATLPESGINTFTLGAGKAEFVDGPLCPPRPAFPQGSRGNKI
jgi:hypothetical protein